MDKEQEEHAEKTLELVRVFLKKVYVSNRKEEGKEDGGDDGPPAKKAKSAEGDQGHESSSETRKRKRPAENVEANKVKR